MDLGRGASKEDRGGNMYENEQSNVTTASVPTERGYCKILPPEYYCSGTHHSSELSASLPELKSCFPAAAGRQQHKYTDTAERDMYRYSTLRFASKCSPNYKQFPENQPKKMQINAHFLMFLLCKY